jgi:hypothetical protein
MTARGGKRILVELERLGPAGADWRARLGADEYNASAPGECLEMVAGVLDDVEATAITEALRAEAGGLHAVTDEEIDELERNTDPENTDPPLGGPR